MENRTMGKRPLMLLIAALAGLSLLVGGCALGESADTTGEAANGVALRDPIRWPDNAIGRFVVLNPNTHIREGGSKNYKSVGRLAKYEIRFVIGMSDTGWYAFELPDGKIAYISPRMVEFTKRPADAASSLESAANGLLNGDAVLFNDPAVELRIREILGKTSGDITLTDMKKVTEFEYDAINDSTAAAPLTDLSVLQFCTNLKKLKVTNQPIDDIEALRNLEKLEEVWLHGCDSIYDLSPLGGKTMLREVWINGVPVSDVSMILSLPNLRFFNASWGTNIRDISALSQTNNLESFYLDQEVDDFSPLLQHKSIRNARLSGVDREMFAKLIQAWPGLSTLGVANSPITGGDLKLLANHRLTALQLDNCPIGDASAVSTQTHLDDLRLTNCRITDVTPLAALKDISYCLDLRNNNGIKDISPLVGLTRLESLTVPTTAPYTQDELQKLLPSCRIQID